MGAEEIPGQSRLFHGCLGWNGNEIYDGLNFYEAVGQYLVPHFDYPEVADDDGSEAPRIPLLNLMTPYEPEDLVA